MTNTPGNGWPGAPPPQGPGATPPWEAQPGHRPAQQPHPGAGTPPAPQPHPHHQPGHYSQQHPYPQQGPYPQQPHPQQAQGPTGFDPHRALGEPPPASVSIGQFAPPPNRTPLLVTLAALITLVLVIGGGIYVRSLPTTEPSTSPSPAATTPATPGHPFTTPDGQRGGSWEILESAWTDEGLQLQLRIHSESGPISFSFMAFANASTRVITPTSSPRTPDIRTGTATPTRSVTGYVFFPMPRGDSTIILANGTGRQMSALPVKG